MQPAFELWTDEYLTENYGQELVEVRYPASPLLPLRFCHAAALLCCAVIEYRWLGRCIITCLGCYCC